MARNQRDSGSLLASKIVPLDQLALSPQCGFASGIEGMAMTIDEEIAKLKLVVETAR